MCLKYFGIVRIFRKKTRFICSVSDMETLKIETAERSDASMESSFFFL